MADSVPFFTKRDIRKMKEAALRVKVLVPLFDAMGFHGVQEWHGPVEFGKDVVCSEIGRLNEYTNHAIVAKAGKVVGKACHEVSRQTRQAFNTKFNDKYTGELRPVHIVWVVTNGALPPSSQAQILSDVPEDKQRYVRFMDGDELWTLWQEHFPRSVSDLLDVVQQEISKTDPVLSVRAWTESGAQGAAIGFARPDLATDDHTKVTMEFEFPDTPEGRSKLAELDATRRTGSSASIPGQYVRFSLPPAIQRVIDQLFGDIPTDFSTLEISSPEDPRRLTVRITLTGGDGDSTTLEPVDLRLVRSGAEEFMLSNDRQPIPIRFWLTCNRLNLSGQYAFELEEGTLPVSWIQSWLDIQRIFSQPGTMSIRTVETGERWISARRDDGGIEALADRPYAEMVRDLCAVQEHIEQAIFLPWNDYTQEDRESIALVRSLLREPAFEGTWSQSDATMALSEVRGLPPPLLAGEAIGQFRAEGPKWVTIGGTKLYLGRVVNVLDTVRLVDAESVRRQMDDAASEDALIDIRMVPGTSDRVIVFYCDWILKLVAKSRGSKNPGGGEKGTGGDDQGPTQANETSEEG